MGPGKVIGADYTMADRMVNRFFRVSEGACGIEVGKVFGVEFQAGGAGETLDLFLGRGACDRRGQARTGQQPSECDLGWPRVMAERGPLQRGEDRYVVDDPRVVTSLGELKNFTPDGTAALVSAFTTLPDRAADPDVIRIDLATGEITDVTDNGDYDEDLAFAPDGESYAVFSARTSGLFETVAQVRRPNAIGPGLECLFGYLFANHRKELLEPWLVRTGAEQEGELGQLFNTRITKLYRDDEGNPHETSTLGSKDLLRVSELARETHYKVLARQRAHAQERKAERDDPQAKLSEDWHDEDKSRAEIKRDQFKQDRTAQGTRRGRPRDRAAR